MKLSIKDLLVSLFVSRVKRPDKSAVARIILYYLLFLLFWVFLGSFSVFFIVTNNVPFNWKLIAGVIVTIVLTNSILFYAVWPKLIALGNYHNILKLNEARYRYLFENAPVSLWLQDFSDVKLALDELRSQGIEDLAAYLDDHPQFIDDCTQKIRVLDVNLQTLRLYHAPNKEALLGNLSQVLAPENSTIMREELLTIYSGKTEFESSGRNYTLAVQHIDIRLKWSTPPGFEETFKQVLVSIEDVTKERRSQAALRAAEERYRQLVEQVSAVMYTRTADDQHAVLYISPQVLALTGYTQEEWTQTPDFWKHAILPQDFDRVKSYCQKIKGAGEPFHLEYRIRHKNGGLIWLRDQATRVVDTQLDLEIWQGVLIDITRSREVERALRKSEARFRLLLQSQGEGTILLNMKGRFVYVNPAAETLFDVESGSLSNYVLTDFAPLPEVNHLLRQLSDLPAGKSITLELNIVALNSQEKRVLMVTLSPWYESEGELTGGLAVCRDITEQKSGEDRLRYQSTHDALTDLYNRQYFEENLNLLVRQRAFPISLIIADLDDLKQINDLNGHSCGDQAIVAAANILKGVVRNQDAVARIGGDEFAVLLPGQDEFAAQKVSNRIREQVQQQGNSISISLGTATAYNEDSVHMIFHMADQAMYEEKNRKKRPL